jgi:cytochrome b6-f complex iron-sulfur subunit
MDRRDFLSSAGIGAVTVLCSYCLGGCKVNDNTITGPTNVDFTLDLSTSAYSTLLGTGGWLVHDGVLVAKTPSGYIAVSASCTHQGTQLVYDAPNNRLFCNAHGSTFAVNGAVTRGPASQALSTYKVTLNGSSLHVTS